MNIKVGDLVICTDGSGYFSKNAIGIVRCTYNNTKFSIALCDEFIEKLGIDINRGAHYFDTGRFIGDIVEKAPLNNELNRKIYPNYVEYGDHLVPKEHNIILPKE